jgi:hypothetical protein
MATATGRKRQVLANFINDVPSNKGWWFRMPKLNTSGKKSAIHPTDVCLPHLGVPFGISEDCMAAILTEMECLRINKKDGMTQFVQGGWELLRDEFKVAGTNLEWARTKLEGKNTWYIRLGETGELNPIKIFRLYKKGITVPRSTYIGRRRTTTFVREALTKILPAKEIKEMILRYSGVDKDEEEYANNEESKTEEVENLHQRVDARRITGSVVPTT